MLVADVSKQTITKGCAVKDFLESFVGLALNPIAMSICTEKNGGGQSLCGLGGYLRVPAQSLVSAGCGTSSKIS